MAMLKLLVLIRFKATWMAGRSQIFGSLVCANIRAYLGKQIQMDSFVERQCLIDIIQRERHHFDDNSNPRLKPNNPVWLPSSTCLLGKLRGWDIVIWLIGLTSSQIIIYIYIYIYYWQADAG
jgi:hypothetical protein